MFVLSFSLFSHRLSFLSSSLLLSSSSSSSSQSLILIIGSSSLWCKNQSPLKSLDSVWVNCWIMYKTTEAQRANHTIHKTLLLIIINYLEKVLILVVQHESYVPMTHHCLKSSIIQQLNLNDSFWQSVDFKWGFHSWMSGSWKLWVSISIELVNVSPEDRWSVSKSDMTLMQNTCFMYFRIINRTTLVVTMVTRRQQACKRCWQVLCPVVSGGDAGFISAPLGFWTNCL